MCYIQCITIVKLSVLNVSNKAVESIVDVIILGWFTAIKALQYRT